MFRDELLGGYAEPEDAAADLVLALVFNLLGVVLRSLHIPPDLKKWHRFSSYRPFYRRPDETSKTTAQPRSPPKAEIPLRLLIGLHGVGAARIREIHVGSQDIRRSLHSIRIRP